jgi:hypothetical protein
MSGEYNECCGSRGPHKMSCTQEENTQSCLAASRREDGKLVVRLAGGYTRKQKAVLAMKLTMDNLGEVFPWSNGQLSATKQSYPPIRVDSAEMSAYAMPEWWLLLCADGSFEVMHDVHFRRDYEEV